MEASEERTQEEPLTVTFTQISEPSSVTSVSSNPSVDSNIRFKCDRVKLGSGSDPTRQTFVVDFEKLCLSSTLHAALDFKTQQSSWVVAQEKTRPVVICEKSEPQSSTCDVGNADNGGKTNTDIIGDADNKIVGGTKSTSDADKGNVVTEFPDELWIDDPIDVVRCLSDYLQTGQWNNLLLDRVDYYGLCNSSKHDVFEFPSSFVPIYMTEMWQRRFTTSSPVVKKYDLLDVLDQIPVRADWNDQEVQSLVAVSSVRDFLVNPSILSLKTQKDQLVKEGRFEGLKLQFQGIDISKYKGQVVVAGGSLVSSLLKTEIKDYDFFFVGCTFEEAQLIIDDILKQYITSDEVGRSLKFVATCNAWSIGKLQFIFRKYKTVDEILLGFDIDSCCLAYDGDTIWISDRALHAFKHHVNVVCLDRLSATYECRLVKYLHRGFDIFVPGFKSQFLIPISKEHLLPNFLGDKTALTAAFMNNRTGIMTIVQMDTQYKTRNIPTGNPIGYRRRYFSLSRTRSKWFLRQKLRKYKALLTDSSAQWEVLQQLVGFDLLLYLTRLPLTKVTNYVKISDYGFVEPFASSSSAQTDDSKTESKETVGFMEKESLLLSDSEQTNDNFVPATKKRQTLSAVEYIPPPTMAHSKENWEECLAKPATKPHRQTDPQIVTWQKITYGSSIHNRTNFISYLPDKIAVYRFCTLSARVEAMTNIVTLTNILPVWKEQNPGEQISSSFHAKVLSNPAQWYSGVFYNYRAQKGIGNFASTCPSKAEGTKPSKVTIHMAL